MNACCENDAAIWRDGAEERLTQLVFCDLSTPRRATGPSTCTTICAASSWRGVPEGEVAFIHDTDTEAKKLALFGEGERRSRAHPHGVHAEDGRGHQRAAQARRHPRPQTARGVPPTSSSASAHRAPGQHECRGGGVPLRHRRHLRRVPLPARRGKAAIHSAGHDLEVARSHSRRR